VCREGAYTGETIFLAGVFNGGQFSQNRSHRAAIPGFITEVALADAPAPAARYELDVRRAVLSKSWVARDLVVREDHYAHRARRSLLVHTITLENHGASPLTVQVTQRAGPACGGPYGCDVTLQEEQPADRGVR
jgi:hypothetical protein